MSVIETFHGYIETTQDSLLVFEACRRNILPKISRRLQERERQLVRSGSVFVFDEKDSGIKRWTDGLVWSPSRIMGNFLIYRELNKKSNSKQNTRKRFTTSDPTSPTRTRSSFDQSSFQRTRERQLVGSLSELYNFKENGLIKKTISLVVYGSPLHLISYYNPDDVLQYQLRTPSVVPELANLEISPELLSRQNFRIPPMIEPDNQYSNNSNNNNERNSVSQNILSPIYDHHMSLDVQQIYPHHITLPPTPTQSTPNTPLPQQIFRQFPSSSTPMRAPLFPGKEVNSTNTIHYQQHQEQGQQEYIAPIPSIMNTNNTFYL